MFISENSGQFTNSSLSYGTTFINGTYRFCCLYSVNFSLLSGNKWASIHTNGSHFPLFSFRNIYNSQSAHGSYRKARCNATFRIMYMSWIWVTREMKSSDKCHLLRNTANFCSNPMSFVALRYTGALAYSRGEGDWKDVVLVSFVKSKLKATHKTRESLNEDTPCYFNLISFSLSFIQILSWLESPD